MQQHVFCSEPDSLNFEFLRTVRIGKKIKAIKTLSLETNQLHSLFIVPTVTDQEYLIAMC